jgi:5-methylcytosine-specific restriction endonuclease McrA
VTQPLSEFHRNRSQADGLNQVCKACRRIEAAERSEQNKKRCRKRYLANREAQLAAEKEQRRTDPEWRARRNAYNAEYYLTNKKRLNVQKSEYQRRNIAKVLAQRKAFLEAHPDRKAARDARLRAYNRARRAANPEMFREYDQRRRARVLAATVIEPTSEQRVAKWTFHAGLCWLCGGGATEWDHVKPIAKGGSHMLCNLRPACRRCNARKRDIWPFAA